MQKTDRALVSFTQRQRKIESYDYRGDSYYEAIKELESRFSKHPLKLVVKVTLDKMRRTARDRLQNDKPQELRNLSEMAGKASIEKRVKNVAFSSAEMFANATVYLLVFFGRSNVIFIFPNQLKHALKG